MSNRKLKYSDMYKNKIEYEMDYWVKNGMRDGTKKYRQYLDAFLLAPVDLTDKVIADFGCGPFGGITHVAEELPKKAYAVDPLFDHFDEAGIKMTPPWVQVIEATAEDASPGLFDEELDYAFSCNALDHSPFEETDKVDQALDNMLGALKVGGRLCLWVHLKQESQLDYGHDFSITEARILNKINPLVSLRHFKLYPFDHVNDPNNIRGITTLCLVAEKSS